MSQINTVLLLMLTLIGGLGAAALAIVLAIPMLVLIATGEAFLNARSPRTPRLT